MEHCIQKSPCSVQPVTLKCQFDLVRFSIYCLQYCRKHLSSKLQPFHHSKNSTVIAGRWLGDPWGRAGRAGVLLGHENRRTVPWLRCCRSDVIAQQQRPAPKGSPSPSSKFGCSICYGRVHVRGIQTNPSWRLYALWLPAVLRKLSASFRCCAMQGIRLAGGLWLKRTKNLWF